MSNGKAIESDNVLIKVWKSFGDRDIEWLTHLLNKVIKSKRMSDGWRKTL